MIICTILNEMIPDITSSNIIPIPFPIFSDDDISPGLKISRALNNKNDIKNK